MKKILYVITSIKISGPNTVLYNQLTGIDRNKYEPYVLALFKGNEGEIKKIKDLGIRCYDLNLKNKLDLVLNGRKKIRKFIKLINPDIIHSHCILPDYLVCKEKIKKITTIHSVLYEDYQYSFGTITGKVIYYIHLNCLKRFNKIICCSKSSYDALKERIKNLYFVRNGVNISTNIADINMRKTLKINNDSIVYIYTGGFNNRKNVVNLIKIMNENMNNNEHLVLVGRGPCEQEMRKLQTEKVHIIGYNSNVNSYLKESDVYVSYSKSEGLSMSAIEALGNNLFLLLSDIESHKEFFNIDKNIYVGEYFNKDNFSEKIDIIRKKVNNKPDDKKIAEFQKKYLSDISMSKGYEKYYD